MSLYGVINGCPSITQRYLVSSASEASTAVRCKTDNEGDLDVSMPGRRLDSRGQPHDGDDRATADQPVRTRGPVAVAHLNLGDLTLP